MRMSTLRGEPSGTARAVALAALLAFGAAAAAAPPDEPQHDHSACLHGDDPECGALPPELEAALLALTRDAPDPPAARALLLDRLVRSPLCYAKEMSQDQWQRALRDFQLLPPGIFAEVGGPRYFTATTVWTGNGFQGASARAQPAQLTYSFPDDNVSWGHSSVGITGPNALNARLMTLFGAANLDRGREFIRQSLAGWRKFGGLSYTEVADDNTAMSTGTFRVASRGDIRIGALTIDGASGILAFNLFPTSGGDMALDAADFVGGGFFVSPAANYRALRNVVSHEHGHGLGYIHSVPCNNTKLMEPAASTAFDMLAIDEQRGASRNYGDRFAGNNSPANARNLGDLTSPTVRSFIGRGLSTNGASGFNGTSTDWYRFTIGSAQDTIITVQPTGGTYTNGQQSSGCNGSTSTVNASQAGNLNLELRDSAGTTVLMSSSSGGPGVAETITASALPPGTYTIRVIDAGPNANQTLQLYDMTVRVGASRAPPYANAGLNKRIQANTTCWFIGNVNSAPMEPGATITSYAWDLDGDGAFEIANSPTPTRVYTTNGTVNVTLRVTDSFGSTATDSIAVTVFGGSTCDLAITGHPAPQDACQNTPASFSVTASGSGPLSYQWRRNTLTIAGANAPTYTIPFAQPADAGAYDCIVTSPCGNLTSNAADLVVRALPVVTTQPQPVTADAGDSVQFFVSATGASPLSFQWQRDSINIPGATSPFFSIDKVTPEDDADYRCVVSNSCGSTPSDQAHLTVNVPPPACPCDWNDSGSINSQDFFDFLTSFFAGNADFNNDDATNSQDFFDFLGCFFSPPPGC